MDSPSEEERGSKKMKIFQHSIIKTFFRLIILILVFGAGYTLAHENYSIAPIDNAIEKATHFCDSKPEEVKKHD